MPIAAAAAGLSKSIRDLLAEREEKRIQAALEARQLEQMAMQQQQQERQFGLQEQQEARLLAGDKAEQEDRLLRRRTEGAGFMVNNLAPGAELTPEQAGTFTGTQYAPLVEEKSVLESFTMDPTTGQRQTAPGGRKYLTLKPTRAQEQEAGQREGRRKITELVKIGAPRRHVLSAMAEGGQDISAALLNDPDEVQRRAIELEGVRSTNALALERERGAQNRSTAQSRPPLARGQLTPGQALQYTRALRNDFTRETASARTAAGALAQMRSSLEAVKSGAAPAGSQGVLVTFQKILDPTSVVRESEYARSASGLSLLGRLEGQWMKISQGGAGVTPADLEGFVALADQFAQNQAASARETKEQIDAIAADYGLNPDRITREYGDGGGVKTMTRAQLQTIAKKNGVSESDAEAQARAQGYTVQ